MKTRKNIKEIANKDWAEFYNCKPEFFEEQGTYIYISKRLKDLNSVSIKHIGKKTMMGIDENIKDKVDELISICPESLNINLEHFITFYENKNISVESITNAYYVAEDELIKPKRLNNKFNIRKLTLDDKIYLKKLLKTCSDNEIENAEVEIDHEIILGCFNGKILTSVASVLDWGSFYDVGVITHSEYRKLGLGKTVVFHICKEIFKTDKIPLYRCEVSLFSSIGVAKSLGFKQFKDSYFREEYLVFQK